MEYWSGIYTKSGRPAHWIEALVSETRFDGLIAVGQDGEMAFPLFTKYRWDHGGGAGDVALCWRVLVELREGDVVVTVNEVLPANRWTVVVTAQQVTAIRRYTNGPLFELEELAEPPEWAMRAVEWQRLGDRDVLGDAPLAARRIARVER